MHLVGFVIRIYHDARSPELQLRQFQRGKQNISVEEQQRKIVQNHHVIKI